MQEASAKTRFRREPELSGTLPASYYYDPAIFAREREAIWFKTWQLAGYVHDLDAPGAYITADILDQKVFVVRGKSGKLRAFYNVCMHRGHILTEGKGTKTIFTCPFHAWSYDMDGKLRAAGNAENVAGFNYEDFALSEVQVETLLNMVFVNLDDTAPSLRSQTAGLEDQVRATVKDFDRMKFARRDRFAIKANWKFILDQLECYHCPSLHPEVTRTVDWTKRESFEYGIWQRHRQTVRADIDNKGLDKAYRLEPDQPQQKSNIWYLWPNYLFISHWGVANFKVFSAWAIDPETSFEYVDNFSLNEVPTESEIAAFDRFRDVANPQDISAMELQQQGCKARGYRQGRLMVDADHSWRSEHATHHFQRMVWEALHGTDYAS